MGKHLAGAACFRLGQSGRVGRVPYLTSNASLRAKGVTRKAILSDRVLYSALFHLRVIVFDLIRASFWSTEMAVARWSGRPTTMTKGAEIPYTTVLEQCEV